MELDELKASWEAVGEKVEKQLQLNTKLIRAMTHQRYKSKFASISRREYMSGLGCLGIAGWVGWNFDRFDTPVLRVLGGLSIACILGLVVVSALGLRGLRRIDMTVSTYAETVKQFALGKIRFQKLQRLNLGLSLLFVSAFTPIPSWLIAGRDITRSGVYWWVTLPLMLVLQYVVSRLVHRHYRQALKQAEALLTEVDI